MAIIRRLRPGHIYDTTAIVRLQFGNESRTKLVRMLLETRATRYVKSRKINMSIFVLTFSYIYRSGIVDATRPLRDASAASEERNSRLVYFVASNYLRLCSGDFMIKRE